MLHKLQVTDTSQHELFRGIRPSLCESGLHGRISAEKPLLKDTNKKKRLAWAKKHEQWALDRWKCVLCLESKWEIFSSNRHIFVRRSVGKWMISTCVVPTVKYWGGGVMVFGCFAGDTGYYLFRIQGTLNQHGYHSILQRYAMVWA